MPEKTGRSPEARNEITVLDDLIDRCYQKVLEDFEKNPKLGDLLKMIELRRKLLPNERDQKQFWAMLNKIRQKNLSEDAAAPHRNPGRQTARPRKRKAGIDEK